MSRRAAGGRLLARLPRLLPLGLDRARRAARTTTVRRPAAPPRLRRRLEEVRAAVGPGDPRASASARCCRCSSTHWTRSAERGGDPRCRRLGCVRLLRWRRRRRRRRSERVLAARTRVADRRSASGEAAPSAFDEGPERHRDHLLFDGARIPDDPIPPIERNVAHRSYPAPGSRRSGMTSQRMAGAAPKGRPIHRHPTDLYPCAARPASTHAATCRGSRRATSGRPSCRPPSR